MSDFLRVLCTSDDAIRGEEAGRFVTEGGYFDSDPQVSVFEGDSIGSWSLHVVYDSLRQPIVITSTDHGPLLTEGLAEIRDSIGEISSNAANSIRKHLERTRCVISIEIDCNMLSDDAWEMLDSLESFIASRCNGIIYADEGFYNAKLKSILRL